MSIVSKLFLWMSQNANLRGRRNKIRNCYLAQNGLLFYISIPQYLAQMVLSGMKLDFLQE